MLSQPHPVEVKTVDTGQSNENWEDRLCSKLHELSSIRGSEIIQSNPLYVDFSCVNNLKYSTQDIGHVAKLQRKIAEFLEGNAENQASLILLGDSGSGKSTALAHIELMLWNQLDLAKVGVVNQFVPFFFELKMLSTFNNDELLQSIVFKSLYNILNLKSLMEMKQLKLIPVWLFDGFDEMAPIESLSDDLYECGLSIITCRQQFVHTQLQGNFVNFMVPRTPQGATGFFEILKLEPFNLEQINLYLEQWLNAERQYGFLPRFKTSDYFNVISSLPSLRVLCTNPFILSMVAWQIPYLSTKHSAVKHMFEQEEKSAAPDQYEADIKLGLCEILRVFTETYTLNGLYRSKTMPNWPLGLESDFPTLCQYFCEEIAYIIFKREDSAFIVDFDNPDLSALLNNDDRIAACSQFILQSIPVRKSGSKTFSFAHRSFWEYFLACRSMRKPFETLGRLVFSGNRNLLQMHCEILSALPDVQRTFIDLVFTSKTRHNDPIYDKAAVNSASNALSILNFGGIEGLLPFHVSDYHDWRGVRTPQANLNCAQIIGCNFEGADLTGVSMITTFIRDTSMKGADLRGVMTGIQGVLQHPSKVNGISVCPNGRFVASCSSDKRVRIWDLATEQCMSTLNDYSCFQAICYSPDSRSLAFCSFYTSIKIFDLNSGECTASLEGHSEPIYCVTFSPDGRYLASSSGDKTIKLWDTLKGQCTQTLETNSSDVLNVVYSSDGSFLASAYADNSIAIWDVSNGRVLSKLEGHTKPTSVAVSPDGKTLVSGSWDKTVKIWDLDTNKCIATLTNHTHAVTNVAFSPGGKMFASCSTDRTIKLWSINTLECTATYEGHTSNIKNICFTPNGLSIISCSWDKTIKIWPLTMEQCLPVLDNHKLPIRTTCISPNGDLLASGSNDHTIKIWSFINGNCQKTLVGHTDVIRSICFSPDGLSLASASDDKTVRFWEVKTGLCSSIIQGLWAGTRCVTYSHDGRSLFLAIFRTIKIWDLIKKEYTAEFDCEKGVVSSFCISNNSKTLISASAGTVRVWDIKKKRCDVQLNGHGSEILSIALSSDGRTVASCSYDRTIKLWDIKLQKLIITLDDYSECVCFSPDGKILASGCEDSTIKLWDTTSLTCIATLEGHASAVHTISFSPDGRTLASGSFDKTVQLWDAPTLRPLKVLGSTFLFLEFCPEGARMDESLRKMIRPWNISHAATIGSSLCIHPNGRSLLSVSFDNSIKMWDVATGCFIRKFEGQSVEATNCFCLSPDGNTIVSASNDKLLRFWSTSTGEISATIAANNGTTELCFSNNGRLLASASAHNTIKIWEILGRGHELFVELLGHTDLITSLCFHSNGKILASGSQDSSIKIWNVESSTCIGTLLGHTRGVNRICMSNDGRTLISGSSDSTIKFWCLSTFQCIATLEGHSQDVTCVALSKDGKMLASGSCDRTIKVWDVHTHNCMKTLHERSSWIENVCFLSNGSYLVSSSRDKTVIVWDLSTNLPFYTVGSYRKTMMGSNTDQATSSLVEPSGCCTIA